MVRITNKMMIDNFMVNLQRATYKNNKYSNQVATGRKLATIADDPIGVARSLTARRQITQYELFDDTVTRGKSWTECTESVLRDINNAFVDIYELTVQGTSETNGPEDRKNIAAAIKQTTDHILQLANTSLGGQYIFGGHNVLSAPFTKNADGTISYNSIKDMAQTTFTPPDTQAAFDAAVEAEASQHIRYEVGFGMEMDISLNGIEIFGAGADNVFKRLSDLGEKMASGASSQELEPYLGELKDMQSGALKNLVEMGVKINKLKTLGNRYSQDLINSEEIRSQIEDVSQGEAIMNMKMSEAIYRQALGAGARIIMPTLMDFLN